MPQPAPAPALVLDGKALAAGIRAQIARDVAELRANGVVPGLAVALVGEDAGSAIYVRNKVRACAEVGIASFQQALPATASAAEVLALVDEWNARDDIDGILVQFPLPRHLDPAAIVARVAPAKDVDGFGPENLGYLASGHPRLVACTPAGILAMLDAYAQLTGWSLAGKNAVVIGRSLTVGRPMALLLLVRDATVTICHSRTVDLPAAVSSADVVVAAVGSRHLVRGAWIKPGAVVIDVGIHRSGEGTLSGDVDFESARLRAAAISPVPGGVGPMTIAMLLRNTVTACRSRRGSRPAS